MRFELGELWRALRAAISRQRDAVFAIMGPVKSEEALRASETVLNTQKQGVKLLRNVADNVDIVRAAINAKKRHVQALKIKVSGPDEGRAEELEDLLRRPAPGMTWRRWLSEFLEDLLVLDMATVYVWPRRNEELFGLLPIDAATIRLLFDEHGLTPAPPEPAYEQLILGSVRSKLTDDELVLAMMNPRTHDLDGLSPVEVILNTVNVVLNRIVSAGEMLDDSNMPAFFGELPPNWNKDQIRDFQIYWDEMVRGRPHKGVWGPGGSDVKFPPKVEFETEFDVWLMQLVLAVFEVQPQELGFTTDVNRSTGEVQEQITMRRSARPMAAVVSEAVNGAFERSGNEGYVLRFPELETRDREDVRADAQIFIPLGVMTIEEVREELGLDMPSSSGLARGLGRLERRKNEIKIPFVDDVAAIAEIEAKLREDLLAAWGAQSQVIGRQFSGIQKPENIDALEGDEARKWADEEIEARLGRKPKRALVGSAITRQNENGEDWEQLILPGLLSAIRAMADVGAQEAAEPLSELLGIAVDWELVNEAAADFARDHSSSLVKGINDTTLKRLRNELAEWVRSPETFPDLVERFNGVLNNANRADLVAATEGTRAYAEGNTLMFESVENDYGIPLVKIWNTALDERVCPICNGLAALGPIPVSDVWVLNGVEYRAPPGHVRCRCGVSAVPAEDVARALNVGRSANHH